MNLNMKSSVKLFLITFLACLSILTSAQAQVSGIRAKLLDRNNKEVLVVAHRGDWRYAPENSIAAIENAIELGVDVVEVDVQKTKDGHLILMHDKTLDRTTTGKGKVDEFTLAEIQKLWLRNGAAIKTKHKVPTLEEALLVAKGKIMINLDKSYAIFAEVYDVLQKTGTIDHAIMKGTQPVDQVKREFGQYLDKVIFMPIVNLDKKDALQQIDDYLKEINPVAFELLYVSDTNPLPKKIKKHLKGKSQIWYNTLWDTMAGGHDDDQSLLDPDKGYGYLIDTLGATILQTDRPGYLSEYLKEKK